MIAAELSDLGVLQLRGPDSARFLQGQLSADCRLLRADRLLLAGYHTREGRVIALLRLLAPDADTVLAILPRELIAGVAERLRKFVLRAKTQLTDASEAWQLRGFIAAEAPAGALPWPGSAQRWLRIEPHDGAAPCGDSEHRAAFRAGDIADGLPQVYAATSERFVAQMLNLDVLGAIAFDKGCYTGQEVIARAHYRGRVKRRLQRFRAGVSPQALPPGTHGTLTDGRGFIVVDSVASSGETTEFLAVAHTPDGAEPAAAGQTEHAPLAAEGLPLPYGPLSG